MAGNSHDKVINDHIQLYLLKSPLLQHAAPLRYVAIKVVSGAILVRWGPTHIPCERSSARLPARKHVGSVHAVVRVHLVMCGRNLSCCNNMSGLTYTRVRTNVKQLGWRTTSLSNHRQCVKGLAVFRTNASPKPLSQAAWVAKRASTRKYDNDGTPVHDPHSSLNKIDIRLWAIPDAICLSSYNSNDTKPGVQ